MALVLWLIYNWFRDDQGRITEYCPLESNRLRPILWHDGNLPNTLGNLRFRWAILSLHIDFPAGGHAGQ